VRNSADHGCLRCKSVSLNDLPSPEGIQFFECPKCHRQFAMQPGRAMTFRWLHPISLALYPVIFDTDPAARAATVAEELSKSQTSEWLSSLINEIDLELADPTQDLSVMLDCRASDARLRDFLRGVAERLSAGGRSLPSILRLCETNKMLRALGKVLQRVLRPKPTGPTDQSNQTELVEHDFDMPPHGQVLVLSCREVHVTLKANAVFDKLGKYAEGQMPFVGLLIDLGGAGYRFSSTDLGGVAAAIAAWVRGWVAPCAIVLTGTAASDLQKLLNLTKLNTLDQLRIVDTVQLARTHIRLQLERCASTSDLDARSKQWHCIYCGWRCDEPLNDSVCMQCSRRRPFAGEELTRVQCGACAQWNLAIAVYCEWCGTRRSVSSEFSQDKIMAPSSPSSSTVVDMDLREKFQRRIDERAVAEILHWIATVPNRREKPIPGDVPGAFDFWFDGGAGKEETGYVEYRFTNGARATVGAPIPALSVTIHFANGSRVKVQQVSWGWEARPEQWHCIYCGWRCDEPLNDSICMQCSRVRPFAGGEVTRGQCRACAQWNLAIAVYCEWCGTPTSVSSEFSQDKIMVPSSPSSWTVDDMELKNEGYHQLPGTLQSPTP
jgi:hypothetical protein